MFTIYKTNTFKTASNVIMNVLKRVDNRNLDVNHIVIVPDRASLEAERQLLSSVGGSFNIRVLTMRRYANMLLPQYKYMSKPSAMIALAGIIADNRTNMTCYTKGITSAGFAENIYQTISTMKYCNVKPTDLAKQGLPNQLITKLKDIALLYSRYEEFLANGYVDSADKLNLLRHALKDNQDVKNTYYYVYDFDNFTKQELQLIESFAKYGKGVTVACCGDDNASKRHLYDSDVFDSLYDCAVKSGVQYNVVETVSHANDITRQIGDGVYCYNKLRPIECGDFVEIFEGATRVNEVYALACKIQQYVRQGGRFKDIYCVTSDINKYYNAIATVFNEFEIPYFCDKQVCLANQASVMAIVDYLNMFRNNMQLGYVLSFAKNVLIYGGLSNIYDFENFCLKYNINYNLKQFDLGKAEPTYNNADAIRQELYNLTQEITIRQQDSARSYCDNIRNLIEKCQLWQKNSQFAEKQYVRGQYFESKATLQCEDKLNALLVQIEDLLGDRVMTLQDFLQVFNTAVQSVNISVLPVINDCVVFANMAKSRKHDIKFLALLGANHAQMPIIKSDTKLLNDNNMQVLRQFGIDLQPLAYTENKQERFLVYQLMQEPTKKLYVSYTLTDGKDSLLPSAFVGQLCSLFTVNGKPLDKNYKADEQVYTHTQALAKLITNTRRLKDSIPVKMDTYSVLYEHMRQEVESFFNDKEPLDLRVDKGKELFLSKLSTSVTKITDFYACPYKFFLRYGVKVKPREIAKLESNNLGDILHAVLEKYVRAMDKAESDRDTELKATAYFNDIMQDDFYKGLLADATMKNILLQLKKEAVKMCCVVKKQLNESNFVNYATELTFGIKGDKNALKGVKVEFDGGKFELRGKIDRVDMYNDNFVVIDYKSGSTASKYSEADLYYGHKLQLLVYLKAVIEGLNKKPFGFYYFNMHNKFAQKEDVEPYTYKGRCADDADIAKQLDITLQINAKSKRLGLSINKDGTLSKRKGSSAITESQLNAEIDYALKLIANSGKLMQEGYIAVKPFEGKCEYCDYQSVCDYNDIYTYQQRKNTYKDFSANVIENIMNKGE